MNILTLTKCLALLALGSAWQIGGRNNIDPDHPGKCVLYGLVLSPGEEGNPVGQCMRVKCGSANGDTLVDGCGTHGIAPPCKVGNPNYPNEPFPKCCEVEYICPKGVKLTKVWGSL